MKFKRGLKYRNFIDYFSNKLEKKETHAFEKKMMQDAFDSEAFDGLSKVSTQELEQDLADLKSHINAKIQERKSRIPIWFLYAASIAVLIGLGSVLMYLNQYSVQNEMTGARLENRVKRVESPIVEPQISTQDSESIDLMEMIEEDLEMEISDADEVEEMELRIVSEEDELDEKIIPVVKNMEIEAKLSLEQIVVTDRKLKEEADGVNEMGRALVGKVAGVVSNTNRSKSVKKSVITNLMKEAILSGRVVDADEVPLSGVKVIIKGTAIGTVTNIDGQFMIQTTDTNQNYKLTASFIGYEQKEVNTKADSALLVILDEQESSLNEIVVVSADSSDEEQSDDSSNLWERANPIHSHSISKFKEHLIQDLDYSKLEHLHGKHKLKLSFVVDSLGAIDEIVFKGNPDSILVLELKNLIYNGEQWEAAKSKGVAVSSKVRITLKISFE